MLKFTIFILLASWSFSFGHDGALAQDIDFSAIPPTKTTPQTPLAVFLSPFQDEKLREALFREQDRFKLLRKELPFRNWADSNIEYEQMKEYSKRMSRMFLNALKENIQGRMMDHLEEEKKDNPFSKLVDFIKETKKITERIQDHIKNQLSTRKIAVSVKPDLETPSINMNHLLFDKTQISYNVLLRSPAFSIEQKVFSHVSSQLHYQPLFQTLDSALKQKINNHISVHMINRTQFIQSHEKSVIFGLSIDMN